jgi:hypothetical protein
MNGFETILPFLKPIEHLILDDSISEVMVNGADCVFIERQGLLEQVTGVSLGERALMVAVKNIARRLGDDISEAKPIMDSRLPESSRVAAVIPPCSLRGVTLTIRKFSAHRFEIADLIGMGTLTSPLPIPRYQDGSLFIRGKCTKVWIARWRENVIREDGTLDRIQRTVVLGSLTELSRREARSLLQKRVSEINQGRHRARPMMTLEKFARDHWESGALLALKPSSAKYYNFQLDSNVLPALGSHRLCDVTRAVIQHFLLEQKRSGYSSSSVHGIHTILGKVLQAAVECGYLETNPSRGIRIGERDSKRERKLLSLTEIRTLLTNLTDPCRTIVIVAVLTGMRIGEILALRWKRLDFPRGTIEVAESFSNGQFGTPKTKSSRRVGFRGIPSDTQTRRCWVRWASR